ncbi:aminotransferase class V-fold PLP-dependent enzyme [Amedibacillus dolichus]|uniref:Aminotransferase class V-fold PLP-dependent enzyme n=1 Tax=Amedibacillus dolichus TaxID=31971 RepID=A0A415P1I5_9FIRM|nr:aminotransferase class V-fold PLP-dependent enzyme [Amedibacillus dolichus]RHM06630.1 aminotransferase class V-fold PLP-dependent enzyme [Amedibacillus dolichus]
MEVFPLHQMGLEEAKQKQFELVDAICKEFSGTQFLNLGDLGVPQPLNKPIQTEKVEKVLATFFHSEKVLLVTGAGTGAIRCGLAALLPPSGTVLVHKAPIYPTTLTTLKGRNTRIVEADFNDCDDIRKVMSKERVDCALIQYTRQKPDDRYKMKEVIDTIKEQKDIPIITDDNYAALKVPFIGAEQGADLSAFSAFKLLGPEGVGILVGKEKYINAIDKFNYSGGSKVQGWQAMEVLRSLVYTPVALAIQAEENEKIIVQLRKERLPEIKDVFIANSQSKVIIVEFFHDIAEEVLKEAEALGAAPHPIGSESKYEVIPMFYRVSGTYRQYDPTFEKRMIRINVMRSGSETVIRILKESIKRVMQRCF